jgi:DNA-binding beta-propeller fold protein YncE
MVRVVSPLKISRTRFLWAGSILFIFVALWSWPASDAESKPPQVILPPQLEWVGTLRSAADVTPKPGFFKKWAKRIVGLDDLKQSMMMPYGIAVDAQGRVLVADTRQRVVHVFDPVRRKYKTFHAPDRDPFAAPIAIDTDADGRIYVSDSVRARIFVFTSEGKFMRTIGAIDKEESIFKRCTGIAIDKQRGRLYVVDTVAMNVVVMTLDGKVINRLGRPGDGPLEFNYPTQITVAPDGMLWVMDSLNFRVQHLDPNGTVISAFGRLGDAIGEFDKPKGISLDAQGRVYVVEGRNDRVQVYSPEGNLLFFFGHTGSADGEFFLPTGITVDGDNRIYVADAYNRRVEIFHARPEGGITLVPPSGAGGGH